MINVFRFFVLVRLVQNNKDSNKENANFYYSMLQVIFVTDLGQKWPQRASVINTCVIAVFACSCLENGRQNGAMRGI